MKHLKMYQIWLIVWAAVILIGIIYVFVLYHPGRRVDFKTYKPTQLPMQLTIKDTTLEMMLKKTNSLLPVYDKSILLELSNGTTTIQETKDIGYSTNCREHIINDICTTAMTPHHQQYEMTDSTDYHSHKVYRKAVSWTRDGTYFRIDMQHDSVTQQQNVNWANVIDGFQPAAFHNLAIHRYNSGP